MLRKIAGQFRHSKFHSIVKFKVGLSKVRFKMVLKIDTLICTLTRREERLSRVETLDDFLSSPSEECLSRPFSNRFDLGLLGLVDAAFSACFFSDPVIT